MESPVKWIGLFRRDALQRITTGGDYSPEVDGVRFVAIALVLAQHLHTHLLQRVSSHYPAVSGSVADTVLEHSGTAGVMIFFGLSGFILFQILIRQMRGGSRLGLGRYFARRLTRLEPPYLLVMTLLFGFVWMTNFHTPFIHTDQSIVLKDSWLASMFYLHRLVFGTMPVLDPPAWSLEIEVQFYILAPALALILSRLLPARRGLSLRIVAFVVVVAVAALLGAAWHRNLHLRGTLLAYFSFFLTGYLILIVDDSAGLAMKGCFDGLGVAGLVTALGVPFIANQYLQWLVFVTAVACFLIGALRGRLLPAVLSWGWLPTVGGMCYSIYLVHLPIIEILTDQTIGLGQAANYWWYLCVQALVLLPPVGVAATLFFVFVERPCMEPGWPKALWRWFQTQWSRDTELPPLAAPTGARLGNTPAQQR